MLEKGSSYITITYKLRLYHRHQDWLLETRQLYNQVVRHYEQILREEPSFLEQSNFLLLRTLEVNSVGTKEKRAKGEIPRWGLIGFPKIPLYFRRAAIHTAIGLARSQQTNRRTQEIGSDISVLNCSPVFYKGMYWEFQTHSITLKLYTGLNWVWVRYPYMGRSIPEEGRWLSPTLKIGKKETMLHLPVEFAVKDRRTIEERLQQKKSICAVAFPDQDCLAVGVWMEVDGTVKDTFFVRGGKKREAQRRRVLKRLKKSQQSRQSFGQKKEGTKENAKLYQKLKQINTFYIHQVSHEILDYCKKQQISVIVVPNYKKTIPFWKYSYLKTTVYRWQGRGILRALKYKAYREGIQVTTIRPYHISDRCSVCGSPIQRYQEGKRANQNRYGGPLFICPKGHRGNVGKNTAQNIGRYFLRLFQEEVEKREQEK